MKGISWKTLLRGRFRKVIKDIDNTPPLFYLINHPFIEDDPTHITLIHDPSIEQVMTITKAYNKVYKPNIYKEVINNLVYDK